MSKKGPKPWEAVYRERIAAGLEECRYPGCGRTQGLEIVRLNPLEVRAPRNAVILCQPHVSKLRQHVIDKLRGLYVEDQVQPISREEGRRPPEQRWALNAVLAERPRRSARCRYCEQGVPVNTTGTGGQRFARHMQRDGKTPCPGSEQVPEIVEVNVRAGNPS